MEQPTAPQLAMWQNFYVIIGSASAALIGLQFVVIVLNAGRNTNRNETTANAFATPTIVHFCAALLIAAALSAPWPLLAGAAITLGICGVAGVVYAAVVVRRARQQTAYQPVLEDWVWHGALPLIAYATVLIAALLLVGYPAQALFAVGGAALLLLFVGIHNAWDAVVYIAMNHPPERREMDSE